MIFFLTVTAPKNEIFLIFPVFEKLTKKGWEFELNNNLNNSKRAKNEIYLKKWRKMKKMAENPK